MFDIWIQENDNPVALPQHYCQYSREGDALAAVTDELPEQFDLGALYPLALDDAAGRIDVDGKIVAAWTAQVQGAAGSDTIIVIDNGEPAPDLFFGRPVLLRPTEKMILVEPREAGAVAQLSIDTGVSWITMPALDRADLLALHAALRDLIEVVVDRAHCDVCGADRNIVDAGCGPGYYGSMSWVKFDCGHSLVDEDGPSA